MKPERILRGSLARWQWGVLLLLCVGWALGLTYIAGTYYPDGVSDEWDIVGPAIKAFTDQVPTSVKYPHFSFYFFGAFFALAGTLGDAAASLAIARHVNVLVFCGNLVLLYLFTRTLYSRSWALLATFLFSTLPWVMLSGAMVKTEGLLLSEVLLTLIAIRKITGKAPELRWHALAAFGAGAAMGTKLNALPAMLYAFHLVYLMQFGFIKRNLALFAVVFLGTLWASIPSFDRVAETIAYWRADSYFLPGAGPMMAVGEWDAFPYDWFFSFFTTTLPGSMGLFIIFVVGGFVLRALSKWEVRVLGMATLVTLAVVLFGTRVRAFHPYTSYILFFFFVAIAFLKRGAERVREKRLRIALASVVVAICLGQWFYFLSLVPQYSTNVDRAIKLWRSTASESDGSYFVILFPDQNIQRDKDGNELKVTLEERLDTEQPRFIMILSSYFINMCKYKHNDVYLKSCAYYHELIQEKTNYRLIDTIDIDIGKAVAVDPEIRDMAVYFLEKR